MPRFTFRVPLAFPLLLAFMLTSLSGCGSSDPPPPASGKTIVTGSGAQKSVSPDAGRKPKLEGDAIPFQLAITKPLSGRVVATRMLTRKGLDALQSRIEWTMQIEPEGDGYKLTSGAPQIGPLEAQLPSDVLNQMLTGRMYLCSGRLTAAGAFEATEATGESVEALKAALAAATAADVPEDERRKFLDDALSAEAMDVVNRDHWKTMVESLAGKSMRVGESYKVDTPVELPLGGFTNLSSTFQVISREARTAAGVEQNCVRIESRSNAGESLAAVFQQAAGSRLPEGTIVESIEMNVTMSQVVDPATLTPHLLSASKTAELLLRMPNGSEMPSLEVSTEKWEYTWDGGGN